MPTFFIALSTFLLILELFEHILEHINGPLSGLFWRREKCRTEDLRGGAFSIHHLKGYNTVLPLRANENDKVRIVCLMEKQGDEKINERTDLMTEGFPSVWLVLVKLLAYSNK